MQEKQQNKHWSNFWKAGQLTSLPQDFQENYDGKIKAHWDLIYKDLGNNSAILDLCTGNCAVALLASEYSHVYKKEFSITAIDAALISKESILKKFPYQSKNLEKINLISPCSVADINLPSNQFDLITSQYGIEYCQWQNASQKIYQLLKPKGTFAMLTHAKDTEITKHIEMEKIDYRFIFELGVFTTIVKFLNGKLGHNKFIKTMAGKQKVLKARHSQQPTQLLNTILTLIESIKQADAAYLINSSKKIKLTCTQHKDAYMRLQDLLNVTNKISENPQWFHVFIDSGLSLVTKQKVIHNQQHYAGDLYVFRK